MRLLLLEGDDLLFDLERQLVGVAHRTPRAVAQGFNPLILITSEDLVAGLAGDPKLPAHLAHRFAVQQPGHKPQALVHRRTLLPRHRHLPG
jgi:hypothetical protein